MQHETYVREDKVIIKLFAGETSKRIAWDKNEKCILVCSERQFAWLSKGDFSAAPIGVRLDDIVSEG